VPKFADPEVAALYGSLTSSTELIPQVLREDSLHEVVMHVAEGCNLGCTYCFADAGQYGRPVAKWMAPEDAASFAAVMVERNAAIGKIKFFGGEPLMNIPAIESAISVFDAAYEEGRLSSRPRYGAVTNMTIFSPRVVDLVNNHAFRLTGSIDGPEDVHDIFRVYQNGRGSWKVVDRTIRRLMAETDQPHALEAVFGPEHVRLGYSLVDIHSSSSTSTTRNTSSST
jgi:uncharacterized protein